MVCPFCVPELRVHLCTFMFWSWGLKSIARECYFFVKAFTLFSGIWVFKSDLHWTCVTSTSQTNYIFLSDLHSFVQLLFLFKVLN